MTSKVIIRVGEKSEKVDAGDFEGIGSFRFAKDLSVVFVDHGIYYLIITDTDIVDELYNEVTASNFDKAENIIKTIVIDYMSENFTDFSYRVEKAIRTAHGIGMKKTITKRSNKRSIRTTQ